MTQEYIKYDSVLWQNYLKSKYGENIPNRIVLDLGEIDFIIPPLLGVNPDSFKGLQKHNAKKGIF
jgi:hypothetical protein